MPLQRLIRPDVTWKELERDPQTWITIARHSIPVVGVLFFGWSALEGIAAVVLDTLSALYALAAIGAFFITQSMAKGKLDSADWMNLIVTGVFAWVFVAALFTFTMAVLAGFLLAYVASHVDGDLRELASSPSLWKGFGAMLVFQIPRVIEFIRTHDEPSAHAIVEPQTGFLLQRFILIIVACSVLSFVPGSIALVLCLAIAQAVLAASELFGDRLLAPLQNPPGRGREQPVHGNEARGQPAQGKRKRRRR